MTAPSGSLGPPHQFHIPVMGTGFTIDTPLKVARYGVSSVISLVDDTLIEQIRKYHATAAGEPYEEIRSQEDDARARRITAYLNLVKKLVDRQTSTLQQTPFEPGADITRYYEMLPNGPRKDLYKRMLASTGVEKEALQQELRIAATPGSIDVNIMTKVDRDLYRRGQKLSPEYSDAMSALRGFAQSDLNSSVVFSAGLNARLYSYAAQFPDFRPDASGQLRKRIILKVSDFRSAAIQGRFLAKRGLWISEFRIESGLNCGGHAFATCGELMGPILAEFRDHREELAEELLTLCNKALFSQGKPPLSRNTKVRVTVQGGIGTAYEQRFLQTFYAADGTGWGTPFLMVPEATNVDDDHLRKLAAADDEQVQLSDHSPLGVPFWVLSNADSERARETRIARHRPGSACPKGHLTLNTEFGIPLCPASLTYQTRKLQQLDAAGLPQSEWAAAREKILAKTCICHDLAGGVTRRYGIDPDATPAVCCGPNIVNFKRIATLKEMVDHIYGRLSLLAHPDRPSLFVKELMLYRDHLRKECEVASASVSKRAHEYLAEFRANLLAGIRHYQDLPWMEGRERFLAQLEELRLDIQQIVLPALEPVADPA